MFKFNLVLHYHQKGHKDYHLQQVFYVVEGGQFFPNIRFCILEQMHFCSAKCQSQKKTTLNHAAMKKHEGNNEIHEKSIHKILMQEGALLF